MSFPKSNADRILDIIFGLLLIESSSLVPVLFRDVFSHPFISFFHLLVNVSFVTCFRTFFDDPYILLIGGRYPVGGEELNWHQLANHHLMSQQGPNFIPRKAKDH